MVPHYLRTRSNLPIDLRQTFTLNCFNSKLSHHSFINILILIKFMNTASMKETFYLKCFHLAIIDFFLG